MTIFKKNALPCGKKCIFISRGNKYDILLRRTTAKAGLIQTLRQTDSEFISWFEAHCEPVEKKIKEAPAAEHVVGSENVPNVQS